MNLSNPKDTLVNFLRVKLTGNNFSYQDVIRIINAVRHLQIEAYEDGKNNREREDIYACIGDGVVLHGAVVKKSRVISTLYFLARCRAFLGLR